MELPIGTSGASATEVAMRCADAANEVIRRGYGNASLAGTKGRGNIVTETDYAAEQAVMSILGDEFPEHSILSEESASDTRSDGWMWVIDPLDGTKNFSQAIPHFAFNLALCLESNPVLGLTTHPLLDDRFLALRGQGCTMNGRTVVVSDRQTILESVVAIDLGYDSGRAACQLALAAHLWPGMQGMKIAGSAALGFAYVAASKWDIYVHSDLQPWDVAAGLILVREAGGLVRDRTGAEATIFSRETVAANAAIYADFSRLSAGLPWE